jgi:hypothetical protein
MRHLNSEHIGIMAAFLGRNGDTLESAVDKAIRLQKLSEASCTAHNAQLEAEERREAAREAYHDEGNATNHKRKNCSMETCGLEPVL